MTKPIRITVNGYSSDLDEVAQSLARAIWMAALSDEPGAFSSEGP